MKNTTLIDGDILVYKAACGAEKEVKWPDGVWTYAADEQDAIDIFETKLKEITDALDSDTVIICMSDHTANFRKEIYPPYKASRGSSRKPLLLKFMQQYVRDNHECNESPTLEADDIMGILATCGLYEDPVIVTIDKDLAQVPARIYNPDTQEMSLPEMRDPHRFFMQQVLTGDPVDNFPGCPGVGEKTVQKLFKNINDNDLLWDVVVAQYEKKGLTKDDALVQARCAYMLQADNYKNGEITMWGTMYE